MAFVPPKVPVDHVACAQTSSAEPQDWSPIVVEAAVQAEVAKAGTIAATRPSVAASTADASTIETEDVANGVNAWAGIEHLAMRLWHQYAPPLGGCSLEAFERLLVAAPAVCSGLLLSPGGKAIFEGLDVDGDGAIQHQDFLVWVFRAEVPHDEALFDEALSAHYAHSLRLSQRACISNSMLDKLAGLATEMNFEDARQTIKFPSLPTQPQANVTTWKHTHSADATTMIAWALAAGVPEKTRIKVLHAVADSGDAWAFAALSLIAGLEGSLASCVEEQLSLLRAEAFEALPPLVSGGWPLVEQAAIAATTSGLLRQDVRVRSAAASCLARVLRMRTKGVNVSFAPDQALNSVEDVLSSTLTFVDPAVCRGAAKSITNIVSRGGRAVADQVLFFIAGLDGVVRSKDPEKRMAGILALKHLLIGLPDHEEAWKTIVQCIDDSDEEVRRTVFTSILQIGPIAFDAGSGLVMSQLRMLFSESMVPHSQEVRILIVALVGDIVKDKVLSDETVVSVASLALDALQHAQLALRLLALKLLRSTRDGLVPCAVRVVIGHLCADTPEETLEASRTLAHLAPRGEREVVEALSFALANFQGQEAQIVELVDVLANMAEIGGDAVASRAFLAFLEASNGSTACRAAALRGLEAVGALEDERVRLAGLECLQDLHSDVVIAACGVLKCTCSLGDEEVVAALMDALVSDNNSKNCMVLTSLVTALEHVCPSGHTGIYTCLGRRLSHGSWPVQVAALQAISRVTIAASGCPEALAAIYPCLRDKNPDVQASAIEAFALIARPGDCESRGVLELLRDDPAQQQAFQVEMAIDEALEVLAGDEFQVGKGDAQHSWSRDTLQGQTCGNVADSLCSFQMVNAQSEASFQLVNPRSEVSFQLIDSTSCEYHQAPSSIAPSSVIDFDTGSVNSYNLVDGVSAC
jgi:hypothetical protein